MCLFLRSEPEMKSAYWIALLFSTVVALGAVGFYLKTPNAVRKLHFNYAVLTKFSNDVIADTIPRDKRWSSRQYILPKEIQEMGFDSVSVENGNAIFHYYGTALMPYDEYLIYNSRFSTAGQVEKISYLSLDTQDRKSVIKLYDDKWTYAKIYEK
jgi:hypothetical protein